MTSMLENAKNYYHKNEKRLEVGFFIAGFIFDIVMASEIDDLFSLSQQVVYLLIIAALLHYEVLYRLHKWRPPGGISKIWDFRTLILHFFLGSLLNLYSLFYIKSASLLNSLIFLLVMLALVVGNELPLLKNAKVSYKVALYSICLFSFMSILFPLVLGIVGWTPLILAIISTLALFYLKYRLMQKHLNSPPAVLKSVVLPGVSVVAGFLLFYVMGWIPPVPLSVKEQGIYHLIEKKEGSYQLSTERPWWKFWHSSDQDFVAQAGDKIYFYAQIYSPARFSDQIYVVWSQKNKKGNWLVGDRIQLNIVGGRKEGFRGYTFKSNYQEGEWRVQVMTDAGLEISRLYFNVTQATESNPERQFQVLTR